MKKKKYKLTSINTYKKFFKTINKYKINLINKIQEIKNKKEIIKREKKFVKKGTKFIFPLPKLEVISV